MSGKKGQTGASTGRVVRRKDLKPVKELSDEALLRSATRSVRAARNAQVKVRRAEAVERETRRPTS